jgi:hypothetical protein
MHQVSSTYMRKKGTQKQYEYVVTFYPSNGGFTWNATVRCDGVWKGSPHGHVHNAVEIKVRTLVKNAIENLAGVLE